MVIVIGIIRYWSKWTCPVVVPAWSAAGSATWQPRPSTCCCVAVRVAVEASFLKWGLPSRRWWAVPAAWPPLWSLTRDRRPERVVTKLPCVKICKVYFTQSVWLEFLKVLGSKFTLKISRLLGLLWNATL